MFLTILPLCPDLCPFPGGTVALKSKYPPVPNIPYPTSALHQKTSLQNSLLLDLIYYELNHVPPSPEFIYYTILYTKLYYILYYINILFIYYTIILSISECDYIWRWAFKDIIKIQ